MPVRFRLCDLNEGLFRVMKRRMRRKGEKIPIYKSNLSTQSIPSSSFVSFFFQLSLTACLGRYPQKGKDNLRLCLSPFQMFDLISDHQKKETTKKRKKQIGEKKNNNNKKEIAIFVPPVFLSTEHGKRITRNDSFPPPKKKKKEKKNETEKGMGKYPSLSVSYY